MKLLRPFVLLLTLCGLQPYCSASTPAATATIITPAQLDLLDTGWSLDNGTWAATQPGSTATAAVKFPTPAANGRYDITLYTIGDPTGPSTYQITFGGEIIGTFICPASDRPNQQGPAFTHTWKNIRTSEAEIVQVIATPSVTDGKISTARWSNLVFTLVEADPGREPARLVSSFPAAPPVPRQPDGNGKTQITGELKQWHKVTLDLAGPFAAESDSAPNPFTDYRFEVTFTHESGAPVYTVPGYFAADGDAANSSATFGTTWRAHLSPDKPGQWSYQVTFTTGPLSALERTGQPVAAFHGKTGTFSIAPTDKTGRDFRAQGRLAYNGTRYLHFAGTGEPFLKVGPDSPENLLGYADFDDTASLKKNVPLKTYAAHLADFRPGDPTWKNGKGKGLLGALNYLAAKGVNAFSFLTYNAGGDGEDVWPFVSRDDKFHYDCSRLDQWGIVFDHAQARGLFLHFKLQEQENDDHRASGPKGEHGVPEALDNGETGPERKLYLRELIARYGHSLALNWNLGEENTQSPTQQRAMSAYLAATDPYRHPVVVHSFIPSQDKVYTPLLGKNSPVQGTSLQNNWNHTHQRTLKWIQASAAAGYQWVVCNDEQGPAWGGFPCDPGYKGFAGKARDGRELGYTHHDTRKLTLWGNLMAGGAGIEIYYGYQLPENDLTAEDHRSRDQTYDYCRHALEFFAREKLPLLQMASHDALIGNPASDNSKYCFAQPGQVYLVYLPNGGTDTALDLSDVKGDFTLHWYNPRAGGPLITGAVTKLTGGAPAKLGAPPADPTEDWLAVIRK